ncbi:MAG: LysR family transcriptional regulator [Fusobacteriaceae bacterium]
MDIRCFKYIIKIVECGSINKAAKILQLSQPNLSLSVKNVEKEFGFSLFKRNNVGIQLTNEGELFFKSAKKIVAELETIENIPSLFSNEKNISISCTYSFDFMHKFIKFKKKNPPPDIEDSFKETGLIQTIRDVVEQRYRMSLFYCFSDSTERYYELAKEYNMKIVIIAHEMPLVLLVSKKNPLSKKKVILYEDIKNYKFIMYENFQFSEWLKILGFEDDSKILYVFDRGGMNDAINQSMYVTVMMERLTEPYNDMCVEIPIINFPSKLNSYLIYQSSYTLNSREKNFVKGLKEFYSKRIIIQSV